MREKEIATATLEYKEWMVILETLQFMIDRAPKEPTQTEKEVKDYLIRLKRKLCITLLKDVIE